jgi:hypothetical protein
MVKRDRDKERQRESIKSGKKTHADIGIPISERSKGPRYGHHGIVETLHTPLHLQWRLGTDLGKQGRRVAKSDTHEEATHQHQSIHRNERNRNTSKGTHHTRTGDNGREAEMIPIGDGGDN